MDIYINKDIGSFKTPFIGPFTFRQTICIALAAPVCWMIYHYLSPFISPDAAGCLVAIPAALAWAFGWLKPYGMSTERYIKSIFITTILAPSVRLYKTEDLYRSDVGEPAEKCKKYRVSKEAVK